jgi:hypothetical protein
MSLNSAGVPSFLCAFQRRCLVGNVTISAPNDPLCSGVRLRRRLVHHPEIRAGNETAGQARAATTQMSAKGVGIPGFVGDAVLTFV